MVYVGQRCLQTQASSLGAHLLKTYTTESSLAVAIGVDEKTLQNGSLLLSDLEDDWVSFLCS